MKVIKPQFTGLQMLAEEGFVRFSFDTKVEGSYSRSRCVRYTIEVE